MLGFAPTASLPIADDGIDSGSASSGRIVRAASTGGNRIGAAKSGGPLASASIRGSSRIRIVG